MKDQDGQFSSSFRLMFLLAAAGRLGEPAPSPVGASQTEYEGLVGNIAVIASGIVHQNRLARLMRANPGPWGRNRDMPLPPVGEDT